MKSILLVLFISACLLTSAFAQSNNLAIKRLRLDSATAVGKGIGEAIIQEIDKDGGRVFSDDGRIELAFPAGALKNKKKISIQSIANHAANGRGNAYLMEPSGIQFEKPVTLIFHYEASELTGTSAELKGIAWQGENGKWQSMNFALDTVSKTLTTQISHFSSYASFDKIVLKPAQGRVKVEKSLQMEIHFVLSDLENDIALPPTIPTPQWSVNGIEFGNSDVGRISPLITNHAKYTAPVSVPQDNPVAVAAKLNGLEFTFNGRTFRDPALVSHLLIYDKAYRITIDAWADNSEHGACTMRSEDHGAFTLVMEGTRAMMKEISNQYLQIRFNPCPCPAIWVNRPNKGPVNIIGARQIDVTPASLPSNPFPKVRILVAHNAAPLPQFQPSCGRQPPAPAGSMFLPPLIEFEANNEPEQVITLSELTRGSLQNKRLHGVKILIKPIEE